MVRNDAFFFLWIVNCDWWGDYLKLKLLFCPDFRDEELLSRKMMKETIEPPIGRIFMTNSCCRLIDFTGAKSVPKKCSATLKNVKTFCTQQFSTPFSFDTKLGKKVQDHTVLKVHFCPKTQFLSNHSQPNLIITFSWFFKGGKQILTEKFNKNQIECLDSKWHFDTLWWYCQGLLVKVMSTQ